MSNIPELSATLADSCYARVDMPAAEFFSAFRDTEGEFAYSYAGKLDDFPIDLIRAAHPLTPFMVLPPDFSPEQEHKHRQTFVWISQKNTTTPS